MKVVGGGTVRDQAVTLEKSEVELAASEIVGYRPDGKEDKLT